MRRDLKPGNTLLDGSTGEAGLGAVHIADFGLAKILSSEAALTKTGATMGTVPYMAPEQFEGKREIDPRTDVFALGMILWRLLTGRLPVDPDDMRAVLQLYSGQYALPAISTLNSDVPKQVDEILKRSLSIEPVDRPADASELLSLLT